MTNLTIDGDTFRVEVEGDASKPALLLSNSLGTDLSLWDGQMPALLEHFRVVRYDSRGHGCSVANEGPYSLDRLGRDALAILDALGIDRADVMGISMGGAVAQWLMVNAPRRVSRGVLASTSAKFMTPEVWNARIAKVVREGMDETATSTVARWFSDTFRAEAPERIAAIEMVLKTMPANGYAGCGAALRDMDLREKIRVIEHPVLVLTGAYDPAISAQDTACLLEAIANSRHVELPARHISNVEAEAAFTHAALAFLLAKTPAVRMTRDAKRLAAPTSARRKARRSSAARGAVAKARPAKAASAKASASRVPAERTGSKPLKAKARASKPEPVKVHSRKAAAPARARKADAIARSKKSVVTSQTKRVLANPLKAPWRIGAETTAKSSERKEAASAPAPAKRATGAAKPSRQPKATSKASPTARNANTRSATPAPSSRAPSPSAARGSPKVSSAKMASGKSLSGKSLSGKSLSGKKPSVTVRPETPVPAAKAPPKTSVNIPAKAPTRKSTAAPGHRAGRRPR